MIEAFIRGDNRPSRDLLADDPSLIYSRHPELGSAGHVSRAQQKLTSIDMPESAIASGRIDFVLSPEDIAKEIVRIAG